jgi:hypothetical protein
MTSTIHFISPLDGSKEPLTTSVNLATTTLHDAIQLACDHFGFDNIRAMNYQGENLVDKYPDQNTLLSGIVNSSGDPTFYVFKGLSLFHSVPSTPGNRSNSLEDNSIFPPPPPPNSLDSSPATSPFFPPMKRQNALDFFDSPPGSPGSFGPPPRLSRTFDTYHIAHLYDAIKKRQNLDSQFTGSVKSYFPTQKEFISSINKYANDISQPLNSEDIHYAEQYFITSKGGKKMKNTKRRKSAGKKSKRRKSKKNKRTQHQKRR